MCNPPMASNQKELVALMIVVPIIIILQFYFQLNSGYQLTSAVYGRTILSAGHVVAPSNLNASSYWFNSGTIGLEQEYPLPSIFLASFSEITHLPLNLLTNIPLLAVFLLLPIVWTRLCGIHSLLISLLFEASIAIPNLLLLYVGRHTFGFVLMYMAITVLLLEFRGVRSRSTTALMLVFVLAMAFSHYGALFEFMGGLAALATYEWVASQRISHLNSPKTAMPVLLLSLFLFVFRNPILASSLFGVALGPAFTRFISAYLFRILHPFSHPAFTSPSPANIASPLNIPATLFGNLNLQAFLLADIVLIALSIYALIRRRRKSWAVVVPFAWFIAGTVLAYLVSYGLILAPGTIFYATSFMGLLLFAPWIAATKKNGNLNKRRLWISALLIAVLGLNIVGTTSDLALVQNQGINHVYPFELSNLSAVSNFLANSHQKLWSSYGASSLITQNYLDSRALGNLAVNPLEQDALNISQMVNAGNSSGVATFLARNGYNGFVFYYPDLSGTIWGDANGYAVHIGTDSILYGAGLDVAYNNKYSVILISPTK